MTWPIRRYHVLGGVAAVPPRVKQSWRSGCGHWMVVVALVAAVVALAASPGLASASDSGAGAHTATTDARALADPGVRSCLGSTFASQQEGAVPDMPECGCGLRFRLFILHRANPHLTVRGVERALEAGFRPADVVVVDSSREWSPLSAAARDEGASVTGGSAQGGGSGSGSSNASDGTLAARLAHTGVEVHRVAIPVSYAQAMELVRQLAIAMRLDAVFWQHNDALLDTSPPANHGGTVACVAMSNVCSLRANSERWSILTFHPAQMDVFCAFNVEAMVAAGSVDMYVPLYRSDFDYYSRMYMAGYPLRYGPNMARHVGKGSNTMMSPMSPEEGHGESLFDFTGRRVYYWLKWSSPQPHKLNEKPFEHANSMGRRLFIATRVLTDSGVILLVVHTVVYVLCAWAAARALVVMGPTQFLCLVLPCVACLCRRSRTGHQRLPTTAGEAQQADSASSGSASGMGAKPSAGGRMFAMLLVLIALSALLMMNVMLLPDVLRL